MSTVSHLEMFVKTLTNTDVFGNLTHPRKTLSKQKILCIFSSYFILYSWAKLSYFFIITVTLLSESPEKEAWIPVFLFPEE